MTAVQHFPGAFSQGLGKKCAVFDLHSDIPGIGKYDVDEQKIRPRSQNSIFKKAKRDLDIIVRLKAPSVGEYNLSFDGKKAPAYCWSQKLTYEQKARDKVEVGPSRYNPIYNQKQKQPSFSFSYRNDSAFLNSTPGPATYFDSTQQKKKRTFEKNRILTASNRQNFHKQEFIAPGPGSYNPPLSSHLQRGQESYTIGYFGRDRVATQELSPGPGQYETVRKPSQIKGVIFGSKQQDDIESITPGPGAYQQLNLMSTVSSKMGQAVKIGMLTKDSINNPGPGFYEASSSLISKKSHQRQTSETFQRSQRPISHSGPYTPGPASYIDDYSSFLGTSYTINFKRVEKQLDYVVPGPGQYEVDDGVKKNYNTNQSGFSKGMRSDFSSEGCTPARVGPGQYKVSMNQNIRQSFGKAKRWNKNQESQPGYYNIGGKMGKLPNYMIISKDIKSFINQKRENLDEAQEQQ